jgi:hypothetical protein
MSEVARVVCSCIKITGSMIATMLRRRLSRESATATMLGVATTSREAGHVLRTRSAAG